MSNPGPAQPQQIEAFELFSPFSEFRLSDSVLWERLCHHCPSSPSLIPLMCISPELPGATPSAPTATKPTISADEITTRLDDLDCDVAVIYTQAQHDSEQAQIDVWRQDQRETIDIALDLKQLVDQQLVEVEADQRESQDSATSAPESCNAARANAGDPGRMHRDALGCSP